MKSVTPWISLLLSSIALLTSVFAFRHARQRDSRDVLLRLFDQMNDSSVVEGRRALYRVATSLEWWRNATSNELHLINQSLAVCDIVGYYVYRGWVRKESVLEFYGEVLARAWGAGESYIAWRRDEEQTQVWRFFEDMVEGLQRPSRYY